jgi:antitoxin ParD1/3/4
MMTQAKTQTLSLGERWNNFISTQVELGEYASASEVVRDALQLMEERQSSSCLGDLRVALQEGEDSGDAGPMDAAMIKTEVLHDKALKTKHL